MANLRFLKLKDGEPIGPKSWYFTLPKPLFLYLELKNSMIYKGTTVFFQKQFHGAKNHKK